MTCAYTVGFFSESNMYSVPFSGAFVSALFSNDDITNLLGRELEKNDMTKHTKSERAKVHAEKTNLIIGVLRYM